MTSPLDDERIQFFLRHRDDIREWAAIEKEVIAATREILARTQTELDERLRELDARVETTRRDGGRYERILVRRPEWPHGVGVALEWDSAVDPFGGSRPKFGLFILTGDRTVEPARDRIVALAGRSKWLRSAGYKVPGDQVWPAVRWVVKSATWWQDPDAWATGIVDALVELWPQAAPLIDEGLAG